jgi:glucose-6-phosphate isomerase
MKNLTIDVSQVAPQVTYDMIKKEQDNVLNKQKTLTEKSGKGNDFLGWLDLPEQISQEDLMAIEKTAANLRGNPDFVVVVGLEAATSEQEL